MNKSKNKGSSWELTVSKFLEDIYQEPFSRTPGSGAYVGGTNQDRKSHLHENTIRVYKGDIIPGPSFSKLNIECKNYNTFPFNQLLNGGTVRILEDWIGQCLDAADVNDFSMLFLKFSRQGTFVMLPYQSEIELRHNYVCYQSAKYGLWLFADIPSFFNSKHNQHLVKTLSQSPSLIDTTSDSFEYTTTV